PFCLSNLSEMRQRFRRFSPACCPISAAAPVNHGQPHRPLLHIRVAGYQSWMCTLLSVLLWGRSVNGRIFMIVPGMFLPLVLTHFFEPLLDNAKNTLLRVPAFIIGLAGRFAQQQCNSLLHT